MRELIAQGAEAKLYKVEEQGKIFLIKERGVKAYRLKVLDEKIRKLRTRRELVILQRAAQFLHVPKIMQTGKEEQEKVIQMEFLAGQKVADVLDKVDVKKRREMCERIGEQVAQLHAAHIIHGDLTTSNMIVANDKLFFIDFGLSFIDRKIEHKAVDLHVLKQALESKHYQHFQESFAAVLEGYKRVAVDAAQVLERLEKVEKRGHYKQKQAKF